MRIFVAVLMLGCLPAHAQPACNLESAFKNSTEPAELAVLQSLKGTVATGGTTRCSGTLVAFRERNSTAKALVLSAGHCSEQGRAEIVAGKHTFAMPENGEVLYRVRSSRPMTLETGKSEEPRTCVEGEEIVYATMTVTDVMLVQLSESYEQIERRSGVRPFLVSQDAAFSPELAIRVPSARWQNDRACRVETTIGQLKESQWTWGPVLRIKIADTCGFPHGASGAPAIREDNAEIIGVVGTASDASGAACELNNPCEIAPDGTTKASAREQGYVHFVGKFYSCLDGNRNVDLDVPGCLLPKPTK